MNSRSSQIRNVESRRGVVLIVVVVVVAFLAVGALYFAKLMRAEREAVDLRGAQAQAQALVDSGVDVTRMYLARDAETRFDDGGHYDNPALFSGVLVVDSLLPEQRGRFSVVSPALDDDGYLKGIRYGLEDESTRLNLAALMIADESEEDGGRTLLMALPGMTVEIADAILDWIDDDEGGEDIREFGAESEYYMSLSSPYRPTNGPPASVEELLLVRGVTPELLFGRDTNRNGLIDPEEADGDLFTEVDNINGVLDRGWSAYLTTRSLELNLNRLGKPRIYLNQEDMATLYSELAAATNDTWATFIVAYRQNGPYLGSKSATPGASGTLDLTRPGRVPIGQVLDLIGRKVEVTFSGADEPVILSPPFPEELLAMRSYLPTLSDAVSVNPSPLIPGRININQASRTVLLGIPAMDEQIVDQIISLRDEQQTENNQFRRHETWLLTEAVVSLDTMRSLMPFVTAGGDVYRGQVVGYFEGGAAVARAEVIIDATEPLPRAVFWRDLTHLGRGFSVDTLGIGVAAD